MCTFAVYNCSMTVVFLLYVCVLCNNRQVVHNMYRCKSLNYTSLYQQGAFSKSMTMMRSCPSTHGAECLSVVHHVVWLKYVHILLYIKTGFFYMFRQSHNLTSYLIIYQCNSFNSQSSSTSFTLSHTWTSGPLYLPAGSHG